MRSLSAAFVVVSDSDKTDEGSLGDFTNHTSKFCTTGGATTKTFTPAGGSSYYLVVPRNANREGSYGLDGDGLERPAGGAACAAQELAGC